MSHYVILCTIPHTGTNFFEDVFQKAGYKNIGINTNPNVLAEPPRNHRGWLSRIHISKDAIKLSAQHKKLRNATLVTTIRDYESTAASWKARNRQENLDEYMKLMDEFVFRLDPFQVTFMPIKTRDVLWDSLASYLGIDIVPEWDKPKNARVKT